MDREKKKEIIAIIFAFFLPVIIFSILVKIWKLDLNVPYWCAQGDGATILFEIKNFMEGNFIYYFPRINAPNGFYITESVPDGLINFIFMFILARVIQSVGGIYNVFYIAGFSLTSLCAYLVLRKFNLSRAISLMLALLFSFLPYHFMRAIHINLVTYYYVPFIVFALISINLVLKNRIYGILGMILVAFGSLYYTAFTMILITFTLFVMPKSKRNIKVFIMYMLVIISCIMILYCSPKINRTILNVANNNGKEVEIEDVKENMLTLDKVGSFRNVSEFNDYGLKEYTIFMPTLYHRFPLFAKVSKEVYKEMNIGYDAYMTSIGLLIFLGLFISVSSVLVKNSNTVITLCGKYNIFLLLLSITGGLNIFIGQYFSTAIRCFNRTIVFISFFSIISLGVFLQKIYNYICTYDKKYIRYIFLLIILLITIFGIWDQTPSYLANNVGIEEVNPHNLNSTYNEFGDVYNQKLGFWNKIENDLSKKDTIYTLKGNTVNEIGDDFVFTEDVSICQKELNSSLILSFDDAMLLLDKMKENNVSVVVIQKDKFQNIEEYYKQKNVLSNNNKLEKYVDDEIGVAFKRK